MDIALKDTLLAKVYDVAIESPLEHAPKLSEVMDNNVYLKREDLQPVKSFKLRGAYNKIAHLSESEKKKGIICSSAGNHAQGVALSAKKLGIDALIVMPSTTPDIKIEAVKSYGVSVELYGNSYSETSARLQKLTKETGRILIHPFDDPLVIAGQGTVAREILEQLPNVDYIFVPIGGGGLIAGVAQYIKLIEPSIKIIGVESTDSNSMELSLKAKKRVELEHVGIFADGVAVKQVGKNTFKIASKFVDEVMTVSTDQTCAAIKSIFEQTRGIVEPAGALGLAGLENYVKRNNLKDKNMVAICSGANMSFERLQFIAERTLVGSGREALFCVTMPEKPGALQIFCDKVVNGYSITEFNYRLNKRKEANIFAGIKVGDESHKSAFMKQMEKYGYKYIDLSDDELAKDHVRHMIGGPSEAAKNEVLYEIIFPEKPGALAGFLKNLGAFSNISLFHYRGVGADVGKVLVGFETTDIESLENIFIKSKIDFSRVKSASAGVFL
ncbi:threonine ammonia-lyase, biosynthetic [Candidatus Parcubacteria bacterium]|nr:threonine ammonia-lyase, biosynthetic [Candidatus Parcubacteria bacterium]